MQNNDRLQYTRVAVSDGLSSFKVRGYHEALALASVKKYAVQSEMQFALVLDEGSCMRSPFEESLLTVSSEWPTEHCWNCVV